MALFTTRTMLLIIPKVGTIRVTPQGGRKISIAAPESVEITDRKGRRLDMNRKRLTPPKRPG